jgi:uncharacterized peroxidase-related enzyme
MSWTRSLPPSQASGPVAETFGRIRFRSSDHRVSHFWQALALDPGGLDAWFGLVRALIDDAAPLTTAQAEMIAVVVSATNGCGYCVVHHGHRLARSLGNEAMARAVALDYREADLAARDRVLLDYAVALSCEPAERTELDVERVREYGFDDATIIKATEITAYLNGVNRLASALGVMLEPGLEPWEFGEQK